MAVSLLARLGLDPSGFNSGLDKSKAKASDFGSSFKKIAAGFGVGFGVAAIAKHIKDTAQFADSVGDLSEALGVSTDAFQAFISRGKSYGATQENIEQMLNKVKAAQVDAADSTSVLSKKLEAAGVSAQAFADAAPEDALAMVSKGLSNASTEATSLAAVFAVIGERVGPRMLALLRDIGQSGVGGLIGQEMSKGNIIAAGQIRMLGDMDNTWQGMVTKLKVMTADLITFGGSPAWTQLVESENALAETRAGYNRMLKESQDLIDEQVAKQNASFQRNLDFESQKIEMLKTEIDYVKKLNAEKQKAYEEEQRTDAGFAEKNYQTKKKGEADIKEAKLGRGVMGGFSSPSSFESLGAQIGNGAPMTGQLNKLDRMIQIESNVESLTRDMNRNLEEIKDKWAASGVVIGFGNGGGVE